MSLTLVDKYRPKSWEAVFGNEHIIEVLKRMIANDTCQHMMFIGPPGCGNRFGWSSALSMPHNRTRGATR